jgi:hypothetical protein
VYSNQTFTQIANLNKEEYALKKCGDFIVKIFILSSTLFKWKNVPQAWLDVLYSKRPIFNFSESISTVVRKVFMLLAEFDDQLDGSKLQATV